jgi:ABC-type uncharacterized transport system permease subunit
MAAGVPARLTVAQGRRFGLTVGGAFLVFAAIAWWRGHPTTTNVLGALGGVLALAGLAIPTLLGPVERAWMKLAHVISKVTTPIVMAVMYLLVLTPVGLLRRAFGGNPLVHQPKGASYWKSRPEGSRGGNLTRQF